jgi:hypothetical protein
MYSSQRGEFWSECVEHMSGVAHTCEKNERPPRTAPVENFEFDVRLDRDHLDRRRRDFNFRLPLGFVAFG